MSLFLSVSLQTFPEIIPHVLEAVKLLESVYMVPLNVPDSPSNPEVGTTCSGTSEQGLNSYPHVEPLNNTLGLIVLSLVEKLSVSRSKVLA